MRHLVRVIRFFRRFNFGDVFYAEFLVDRAHPASCNLRTSVTQLVLCSFFVDKIYYGSLCWSISICTYAVK